MLLTIRLIHINDAHSALDRAGRVRTIVETARRVDPGALLLHAGDALVGTPWYDAGGRGDLDMRFVELLRPDAYAIGNHELDAGLDRFREAMRLRRIPLTVANWQIHGPLRHRVKPYRLRTVQAGASHEYVGLLELDLLDGKVANAQGSLLRVRDDIPSDLLSLPMSFLRR